jgi:hypothetical protein
MVGLEVVPQATCTSLVEGERLGAVLADSLLDNPGSSSPSSLGKVVPDVAKEVA